MSDNNAVFPFAFETRVIAVREHTRTIRGRKDLVSGSAIMDHVSLGWFVVTDLDEGGIGFCVGPTMPTDVKVGDTLIITMRKKGTVG